MEEIRDTSEVSPVAPFAGAWIEIVGKKYITAKDKVAPFAGAWIEMLT